MSDLKMPELRLPGDPVPAAPAAAATAAAQPAAPTAAATAQPAAQPAEADPSLRLDALSEEERAAVLEFVQRIDIHDAQTVLGYGNEAQEQISQFSDRVLENVRTKDTGEISDMLAQLVAELKGFDANEEKKGFFSKLFNKAGNEVTALKAKYDKVEVNVDAIVTTLQNHKKQLIDDIAMLDSLYENNQTYFRTLSLYIVAGEEKLRQLREEELPPLMAKAQETGDPADAQAANDFAQLCDRFEKKLHDLKLTRQVALQMAPQIRMLQNNNALLVERIQSTLVNTLPLWKNQMVLAIGLHHSQQAMKAQRAVTDATNELLKKNAETLKMGTLETAKEAERGIIDLETLTKTNQDLIDTITEVQRIQKEGRDKRREAEKRLAEMEDELKKKMLES